MIATRLKEARKNKKLTQEELAHKVGTKKSTISNYENEYSAPSNRMLGKLADALGVTSDYLIGRVEIPTGFMLDFSTTIPIEDPAFNLEISNPNLGMEKIHELRIQAKMFETNKEAFEERIAIPIFVDEDNNVNLQVHKDGEYLNKEDTELLNAMIRGFLFNKNFINYQENK
ncbi:helix-turn-helix transcriptional regulator [Bacillus thuringiensis]|uniref:helix-turn-helix domain-containing protein n=1 Tax=Bacillus thuringiensis TaxID=1428 RepID=UPI000BF81718|nr:hypothetical protein CN469_10155 [Bacillus cereus]